jgi:hypothetical protein
MQSVRMAGVGVQSSFRPLERVTGNNLGIEIVSDVAPSRLR